ncbi:questin oxidase family protein [Winogradskya consettensis]|nr:questin oxidase family protein [Actinoplanes consettensis]
MTTLDEALTRLRDTGPERNGWLSNHAPMAVEALAHHGHDAEVHRWIDGYRPLLEDAPRGIAPIAPDEWRDPLGDPVRTGDWITFFERELALTPWRDVLAVWWPRLLPGIAAGATHGVIRVGHAVRALLAEETPARIDELGRGLAYWAARWQPLVPAGRGRFRGRDPRAALDAVPRVPDQRFGIRNRLAQLAALEDWPDAAGSVPGTGSVEARLRAIVTAAILRYTLTGTGTRSCWCTPRRRPRLFCVPSRPCPSPCTRQAWRQPGQRQPQSPRPTPPSALPPSPPPRPRRTRCSKRPSTQATRTGSNSRTPPWRPGTSTPTPHC